jgi:hypothetical protein
MLTEAASSFPPHATTTTDGPTSSPATRVLNPRFAEILMNLPAGWTDPSWPIDSIAYAQWETAACRWLRALRTSYSQTGSA